MLIFFCKTLQGTQKECTCHWCYIIIKGCCQPLLLNMNTILSLVLSLTVTLAYKEAIKQSGVLHGSLRPLYICFGINKDAGLGRPFVWSSFSIPTASESKCLKNLFIDSISEKFQLHGTFSFTEVSQIKMKKADNRADFLKENIAGNASQCDRPQVRAGTLGRSSSARELRNGCCFKTEISTHWHWREDLLCSHSQCCLVSDLA